MTITKVQKQVLKKLIDLAKTRGLITYEDLSEAMGRSRRCPRWLNLVLGNISEYTYDQLGIFLSALVINNEGTPGPGFINVVNHALDSSVDNNFVQRHLKCIYAINPSELNTLLIVSTR